MFRGCPWCFSTWQWHYKGIADKEEDTGTGVAWLQSWQQGTCGEFWSNRFDGKIKPETFHCLVSLIEEDILRVRRNDNIM